MNRPDVHTTLKIATTTLALLGVTLTAGMFVVRAHSLPLPADLPGGEVTANFIQADNHAPSLAEVHTRTREFILEVHKIHTEIAPGVRVEQWAYGFPGQTPTVPGPELRVKQGETVKIRFRNTHDQPHTVHLHGIARLSQDMDGLAPINPGQEFVYEFIATDAGTFAYHCHFQTYLHADMGMYGAIIVEPEDPREKLWTTDHTLVLDEWDSRQDPKAAVHVSHPNYFLLNGKSFPLIPDISIPDGNLSLLRVVNMGEKLHSLHMHGNSFLIMSRNGYPLRTPSHEDTLVIAPGERADLLVKGRDGNFPIHDHIIEHVTNNGVYPGGIHLMINGGPARDAYGNIATPQSTRHAHGMTTPEAAAKAAERATNAAPPAAHAHGQPVGAVPHSDPAHHDTYDHLPAGSAVNVVNIKNFAYDTPELRVKVGTTVAWVNRDAVGHTVTAGQPGSTKDRAFDSSNEANGTPAMLEQGEAWTHTFNEKGTFEYFCLPHTNMTAKVIVE